MVCSVCKKNFIRSVDLTEFHKHKQAFEAEVSKAIDLLSDEQLAAKNDQIWDELLKYEAILLHPNYKPKKCAIDGCESLICTYCYVQKHKHMCSGCLKKCTI